MQGLIQKYVGLLNICLVYAEILINYNNNMQSPHLKVGRVFYIYHAWGDACL